MCFVLMRLCYVNYVIYNIFNKYYLQLVFRWQEMKEGRYDKLKNINERLVLKNKFVEQLSN